MTHRSRALALVLCTALWAGCTTTYTSPGLESQDPSRVATLTAPSGALGTGTVRLMAVDGQATGDRIVTTALLAPGKRRLRMELEKGNARPAPIWLELEAVAGARYAVRVEIAETERSFGSARGVWNVWIVDEATGAVVSRRVR